MWNVTKKLKCKEAVLVFTTPPDRKGFKNCRKSATSVIGRFERHYQWLKRDSVRMLKSLSPAVRSIRQTSLMDSGIGFHGTTYTNSQKIKVGIQYWFLTDPAYQQQINRFHFQHKAYFSSNGNTRKWHKKILTNEYICNVDRISGLPKHYILRNTGTISSLSQANPAMPAKEHVSN